MEDRETFTKSMLAKSQVDLDNPDFERLTMHKISRASAKKGFIKNLFLACLIILTLETIIFLVVWFFPPGDLTTALITSPHYILPMLVGLGEWIVENQYLTLPMVILLIIRKMIESKFGYG